MIIVKISVLKRGAKLTTEKLFPKFYGDNLCMYIFFKFYIIIIAGLTA